MGSALSPPNLKRLGWDFLLLKVLKSQLLKVLFFQSVEMFFTFSLSYHDLFADLQIHTCIPYFGVLYLQEVATKDSVDPLELPHHLSEIWNRVVLLGNQPIVHEEGSTVRLRLFIVI